MAIPFINTEYAPRKLRSPPNLVAANNMVKITIISALLPILGGITEFIAYSIIIFAISTRHFIGATRIKSQKLDDISRRYKINSKIIFQRHHIFMRSKLLNSILETTPARVLNAKSGFNCKSYPGYSVVNIPNYIDIYHIDSDSIAKINHELGHIGQYDWYFVELIIPFLVLSYYVLAFTIISIPLSVVGFAIFDGPTAVMAAPATYFILSLFGVFIIIFVSLPILTMLNHSEYMADRKAMRYSAVEMREFLSKEARRHSTLAIFKSYSKHMLSYYPSAVSRINFLNGNFTISILHICLFNIILSTLMCISLYASLYADGTDRSLLYTITSASLFYVYISHISSLLSSIQFSRNGIAIAKFAIYFFSMMPSANIFAAGVFLHAGTYSSNAVYFSTVIFSMLVFILITELSAKIRNQLIRVALWIVAPLSGVPIISLFAMNL